MTLQHQEEFLIPEETRRIAHAAYPKGSRYIRMRDALGTIYQDQNFAHLFPHNGRPVEAPWRLALVTVLQFMEELPDRQAADAVRGRIDWKYLLGLPLDDPGFDFTLLSDFRTRLVQGQAEHLLLERMLTLFQERGWLKEQGKQRTDSTHIWQKFVRSTDSFVLEKQCVLLSTVWRSLRESGFLLTMSKSGPVAMDIGWKKRVCQRAKHSAKSSQR